MAEDTTKLTIDIVTLLKGLDKTLAGLAKVEAQLKRVAAVRVTGQTAATGFDRATASAHRLEIQQGRLNVQAQRLANQQERVNQATARLDLSQQRLARSQERIAQTTGAQADAHVRAFRAIEAGTRRANQQLITFGNAARSIGQGLASLGATLTVTLTAPLTALGVGSVTAAVQLDSLKRGLTAIVGSSSEAGRQLARLTQLAKLPGIGFEEAIQGSIRLQAVGFSALEAERALRQFSNAVALTGGGRDELARITVQLGQLAAKGKVLSQDLRPIIEAAPAVGRALKQAFGTVNADDIAELSGSSQEFLRILVAELERLPRAAAGAKNAFENFRDTVFRAAAAIGEALLPVLTRLVEVVGPVITAIAEGFRGLPGPLQAVIVAMAALLAIAGPLVFIIGQLVLGIGRVVVGVIQVNAALPATTTGLFGLATGANAASGALATLRTALIATGVGLAAIAVQIGVAILAYAAFNRMQKQSAEVTQEQVAATEEQVASLKDQAQFLDSLRTGVKRTADEQERLNQIYLSLNAASRVRIENVVDEEQRTAALRVEVERLLQLRLQEREQLIARIAADLANAETEQRVNEQRRKAISDRIQENTRLITILQQTGRFTDETTEALRRQNVVGVSAAQAVEQLQQQSERLSETQGELITRSGELTTKGQQLGERLRALGIVTRDQIRNQLILAQAMGVFKGSIDDILPSLEKFIILQQQGATATDAFTQALNDQTKEALAAGKVADEAQKQRRAEIASRASVARETTRDFEGALKLMKQFLAAQPQFAEQVRREAAITGKTVNEILVDALGGRRGDRGTALRNAQEQLNDALAKVQQEAAEKTIAEEKSRNDQLLRINELRFSRELISFKQFVVERARLQRADIQGEIDRQRKIAELAAEDVKRAQTRAGTTTGVEQVKARTDEQRALATKTQAETKILDLQSRQRDVFAETARDLDQFTTERLRSFRELSRELDEIVGREQEAAEAAINERFAEQLRTLRNELKLASQDFIAAQVAGSRVATLQAAATAEQLRNQITAINNHKRELKAVAEVRQAQEEIRRAEEAQANLERQLTFEVEFRGLTEQEAIRRRLEGEAKIREAIDQQRVRLEVLMATLKAAGLEIPLALAEAIERLRVASLGLGELSFVEQFRLAQKEFDRLNDLRIRKIQEVERAVAHRDISELQGRIAIRAANGEYIGALEEQLRLLQQIAKAGGDEGLKQQAADMKATTREVENATTEIADLDKAIQSVSIDALHDSFAGFLNSLRHGADAAKEALLDMLDSVLSRVNQIIADRLFEKLFGGFLQETPAITQAGTGALGSAVGQGAGAALQISATTASAALTAGGTTAGAALVTGATTASAGFLTGVTGAAASFASIVAAAGAAFAAAVAAASGAQALGGLGSAAAGGAATGIYPAVPGGIVRIVEGGYPEAVLTTDPKHAARQVAILREYLARTKGLFGRLPQLAEGGMVSARDIEADFLRSLSPRLRTPAPGSDMQLQSAATNFNLRNINLIDRGAMVGGYLRSAEGTRDILNMISTERDEVGRRIGVRF